mmetsp:Transcript_22226/g.43318  ORF Transcript_22226/g.43318 Transcript_22226/m.43318 type:complete len:102 (-) Transcript_22226:141-446(-)
MQGVDRHTSPRNGGCFRDGYNCHRIAHASSTDKWLSAVTTHVGTLATMLDIRIVVKHSDQVHMGIVWLFHIVALDFRATPPFDPCHSSGPNTRGESCEAGC